MVPELWYAFKDNHPIKAMNDLMALPGARVGVASHGMAWMTIRSPAQYPP